MRQIEPYRPLFIIGLLHSIIGTFFWINHVFINPGQNYPATTHTLFMMGGFLLSFISGFIMTAIPKFTSTTDASNQEVLFVFIPQFILLLSVFTDYQPWHSFLPLITIVLLVRFAISRISKKKNPLPPSFLFLGVGFLLGFSGLLLYSLAQIDILPTLGKFGKNLFLEGMVLAFIVGVGSRLIPALFGRMPIPNSAEAKAMKMNGKILFSTLAVLFFASYILEEFVAQSSGRLLRAAIVTFVAFKFWKIHKLPLTKTKLNFWLLISCWSIVLGVIGYALLPQYSIHLIHLTFISGFGLMTLMIATRVTLAHGGFTQKLEGSGKFFKFVAVLIILAALTRVLAPIMPSIYLKHLGYASIAWIFGVAVWGYNFIPKLLFTKKAGHEDEEC